MELLLIAWASTWMQVEATAYCPCNVCCGPSAAGITATGRDASLPGIAVDPAVIPLGSRLDIPGASWVPADDTGRLIKGARIDIRMKTHAEAVKFGRQVMRIRVWRRK